MLTCVDAISGTHRAPSSPGCASSGTPTGTATSCASTLPDTSRDGYPILDQVLFRLRRQAAVITGRAARAEALGRHRDAARAGAEAYCPTAAGCGRAQPRTTTCRTHYLPNEPVVLLTGPEATPSDRFRQDTGCRRAGSPMATFSPGSPANEVFDKASPEPGRQSARYAPSCSGASGRQRRHAPGAPLEYDRHADGRTLEDLGGGPAPDTARMVAG